MKKSSVNKRALLSKDDNNSFVVFTCDSCGVFENHLSINVENKGKGYICDYCIKIE